MDKFETKIGNPKVCDDCPYRKDAAIRKWDISEFKKVLDSEKTEYGLGKIFGCHKKNGSICKGFLHNQLQRDLPNKLLRIVLVKSNIKAEALEEVIEANKNVEMYESIEEMCFKNFPQLQRSYLRHQTKS